MLITCHSGPVLAGGQNFKRKFSKPTWNTAGTTTTCHSAQMIFEGPEKSKWRMWWELTIMDLLSEEEVVGWGAGHLGVDFRHSAKKAWVEGWRWAPRTGSRL